MIRLHLNYCIQLWAIHYQGDVELLKHVQRRAMQLVKGLENKCFEERLRQWESFNPGKRLTGYFIVL